MNSNLVNARISMVQNQLRPNKIKEKVILDLFQNIPKENFVPEDFKKICYSDNEKTTKNKKKLEARSGIEPLCKALQAPT